MFHARFVMLTLSSLFFFSFPVQNLPPKLRLRLRISYTRDDGSPPITDQVDWTEP